MLQGSKKASLGWPTLSVKIILFEDYYIHSFEYHLWLLSHTVQQSWMGWRSLPSAGKPSITRCFAGKFVERLRKWDYSTVYTQRNKRGHHGRWVGQSDHSVGRVPALKTQNLSLIPLYKKMPTAVGGTYLWGDRDRWIPGAHEAARIVTRVKSKTVRFPSQNKVNGIPKKWHLRLSLGPLHVCIHECMLRHTHVNS